MTQESAHSSMWQTSDVMILITLFSGGILDLFITDLGAIPIPIPLRITIAVFLVFIGEIIMILAKKEFNKFQQPSEPGKPTTKIVKTGIFKYSRNPLYLGVIVTIIGLGFLVNTIWFIILIIPLSVVFHIVLIIPEEHYLLNKFGKGYEQYLNNVRRWC